MLKKTTEAVEQFRVKVLINGLPSTWVASCCLLGRSEVADYGWAECRQPPGVPVICFDISESLQLFLMYPRPAATFLCGLASKHKTHEHRAIPHVLGQPAAAQRQAKNCRAL